MSSYKGVNKPRKIKRYLPFRKENLKVGMILKDRHGNIRRILKITENRVQLTHKNTEFKGAVLSKEQIKRDFIEEIEYDH